LRPRHRAYRVSTRRPPRPAHATPDTRLSSDVEVKPPPTPRERFARSEAWIADYASNPLEAYEQQFDGYLMRFRKLIRLYPGLRVLEVGAGSGWFMVLCQLRGFDCDGIEHNPFMIDAARERARRHGLALSIREESIETVQLPSEEYDLVVAMSVLEHVEDYQRALSVIQRTLKPGGLFWGNSTNKFSLRSGEYPQVPLYGWLPYSLRRAIRVRRQGPGIVASGGMDFNQFTYFGIRRRCAAPDSRRSTTDST
jgi:SAM-dependent methyltransferase